MGFLMGHSAWQIDQFPTCWPMNGLFVCWSRGWGVSSFSERLVIHWQKHDNAFCQWIKIGFVDVLSLTSGSKDIFTFDIIPLFGNIEYKNIPISCSQCDGCWWPGDVRSWGINSHCIYLFPASLKYSMPLPGGIKFFYLSVMGLPIPTKTQNKTKNSNVF